MPASPIIIVDKTHSTNQYALESVNFSKTEEFTVVWALEQFAGKGQLNAVWESEPHQNLTFSLILFPAFLAPSQQFMLTKVLSIGVAHYLNTELSGHTVNIKWPNDVYVDGKKICGILTHNRIVGQQFSVAVGGIGLNLNQTAFSEKAANPVSLKMLTGESYSLKEELNKVIPQLKKAYLQLKSLNFEAINNEYLSLLLNYNKEAHYLYNGQKIKAIITGVNEFGFLQLQTNTNEEIECGMKEISLIS